MDGSNTSRYGDIGTQAMDSLSPHGSASQRRGFGGAALSYGLNHPIESNDHGNRNFNSAQQNDPMSAAVEQPNNPAIMISYVGSDPQSFAAASRQTNDIFPAGIANAGTNGTNVSSNNIDNSSEAQYRHKDSFNVAAYAPRNTNLDNSFAYRDSSSPADAVNDALKNSSRNSIGSWQSEKRNRSDSDSDMEVWTKPAANSHAASATSNAHPHQSWSHHQTLGAASTMSSLTSNLHRAVANPLSGYNPYRMHQFNDRTSIQVPEGHVSTWDCILPANYYTSNLHLLNIYGNYSSGYTRKKIVLSLINVWEFTLDGHVERTQIKKIAKEHVGKDGRKGALFEKVGILPDDPALKGNENNNALGAVAEEGYKGGGKWRIPLGAYQPLMVYLNTLEHTDVEGIPKEQLQAATFGRERFEKGFPTAEELVRRGVGKTVAHALAPYQRGGVDFILERKGRALLADEMGLGKTVQAIAAMTAYRKEWPLLILTPSSARYHWELEVRQWMKDVDIQEKKKAPKVDASWDGRKIQMVTSATTDDGELKKEAVNVLTSGKGYILRGDKTKVVIVSYGLIVSLINNQRITPGMFQAIIVDESHALKNKASKRTIAVLPLLRAASRCVLLSGTPALAKPSELWPQISVLGGKLKDDEEGGLWMDEADFYAKYVRGETADENASKAR